MQDRHELIRLAKVQDELEHRRIDKLCANDPLYWLSRYTETFDEHAAQKGVAVYKPFPADKPYFPLLFDALRKSDRLIVPKSRQMMASWAVCGYLTWLCQWQPRVRAVIQVQKEDKAAELIEYCRTLYERQPKWMQKMHPLKGGGIQSKLLLLWESGSRAQGIPGGVDQIRSLHPTVLFMDEACHMPEAKECYEVSNPVCSQIVMVSSAAPGWVAELCTL